MFLYHIVSAQTEKKFDTANVKNVRWQSGLLTFNDYKTIDSKTEKDDPTGYAASTSSRMAYHIWYKNKNIKFWVQNYFSYDESSMKSWAKENAKVLNHEQGHFDINEIYCRKFILKLKTLSLTSSFNEEIIELFDKIVEQVGEFQYQYNRQTEDGKNVELQKLWNEKIKQELDLLPPVDGIIINLKVK
ncbi:MAG: hypothetical protein DI598_18420 [Pseudopedobacter saltans]|uniref:DUF922 domain-containing protein n=1 Tax=Pseudopedobacter saltans TaxID=151895 RepID=A0A2W5G715_9SPHI|nr:MAG: hypothetical protein DI598_18420 [Pseudopedobacter saltans]